MCTQVRVWLHCSSAGQVRGINGVTFRDFRTSGTTHVRNGTFSCDQSIHQFNNGGLGMYNKIIKHYGEEEKYLNFSCTIKLLSSLLSTGSWICRMTRNALSWRPTQTLALVNNSHIHNNIKTDNKITNRTFLNGQWLSLMFPWIIVFTKNGALMFKFSFVFK